MTRVLSETDQNLFSAVERNDLVAVRRCLEEGAAVHARDGTEARKRPIQVAAISGHLEVIRFLLNNGVSVDQVDKYRQTALHYASQNNQLRVVELLVGEGADIHAGNLWKAKPIHVAAQAGHVDIIDFYLMKGVSVDDTDKKGRTSLYFAACGGHLEAVKFLVSKGAHVDKKCNDGKTAIDIAIEKKYTQVANFLKRSQNGDLIFLNLPSKEEAIAKNDIVECIEYDSSLAYVVKGKDRGRSAWHYLVVEKDKEMSFLEKSETGRLDCADYGKILRSGWGESPPQILKNRMLGFSCRASDDLFVLKGELKGMDIYYYILVDTDKKTIFEKQLTNGLLSVSELEDFGKILLCGWGKDPDTSVSYILNKYYLFKDESDWEDKFCRLSVTEDNTFHDAARNGELDRIIEFVGKGVDIKKTDNNDWTPLHHAVYGGDVAVMKYLIEHGADLHAKDVSGRKPLHIVAREGNVEAIELCLSKGVRVDDADYSGWTALLFAVWKGHLGSAEFLIKKGANVNAESTLGSRPVLVAVNRGHFDIVKLLISKGVDINRSRSKSGFTALHNAATLDDSEIFRFLLHEGANVHAKNVYNTTVLHSAAGSGQMDVLNILLRMNVNIHDSNIHGWTALHFAASEGHVDVVELLADNNANIRAKITDKKTSKQAVHLAAIGGHKNVVDFLLRKGIDVNTTDKNLWTPLHFAAKNGKLDLVEYLVDNGAVINAETIEADDSQQPIHIAALHGHKNVVEFLLGKGIDVNVTDKRGCTTLHCAAKCGKSDLMTFLVRKGANNCSRDLDNKTPSDYLVESVLV